MTTFAELLYEYEDANREDLAAAAYQLGQQHLQLHAQEVEQALENLYVESDRPYAVYGNPAISTMEELVRFENARIEAARILGSERIRTALIKR